MSSLDHEQSAATVPGYNGSAGSIGRERDFVYDRHRGLASQHFDEFDPLAGEWWNFCNEAAEHPQPATRWTLRAVTSRDVAAYALGRLPTEAYVPLTARTGILYLGLNAAHRQPEESNEIMNRAIDEGAAAVAERFQTPLERIRNLHDRGFRFVNYIPSATQLFELWGPSFRWGLAGIHLLEQRLAENALRDPMDREVWFTGVTHNGQLIAAITSERLNVPSPDGWHPTIESSEWEVELRYREQGVAAGLVAMGTADCLNDVHKARMVAECRLSTKAPDTAARAGYSVPDRFAAPQILPRHVTVDGELANFAPVSLSDEAAERYYGPAERQEMLSYFNREEN